MSVKTRVKKLVKGTAAGILGKGSRRIIKELESAEVISFDLYDTLIKRHVRCPEEIHALVGKEFSKRFGRTIPDYEQRRMQAQRCAYAAAGAREITLEEIFAAMRWIDPAHKQILMELEKELECRLCCANREMREIFAWVLSHKKIILITSDMYLPKATVAEILNRCGYDGYQRLYLSSDCGQKKATGELYRRILCDYKEASGNLIHIGDNVRIDYLKAKEAGLDAILIRPESSPLAFYKPHDAKDPQESVFVSFLSNTKPARADDIAQAIGYEILGPLLWGFCTWLHDQVRELQAERIFFLSREGKLLKKAYELMFPEDDIPVSYLQVSRRALWVPLILRCAGYHSLAAIMPRLMMSYTLENVGSICGFGGEYTAGLAGLGLDPASSVFDVPSERKDAYFALVMGLGKAYFEEQSALIADYLSQRGFLGNVAIADIGWQGSMQKALQAYVGSEGGLKETGFYLGVRDLDDLEPDESLARRGWLFEPGANGERDLRFRFSTGIIEQLFMSPEGSVISYRREEGGVVPVLDEPNTSDKLTSFIDRVQTSALAFVTAWKMSGLSDLAPISEAVIMRGFERFAVRPTLDTVRCFKGLAHDKVPKVQILPGASTAHYLSHPKELVQEMETSTCKTFAAKSVFKLPLPYFGMLEHMYRSDSVNSQHEKDRASKDSVLLFASTFGKSCSWVQRHTSCIPLEVGAALREDVLYPLRDDSGDSISADNEYFGELSGIWWLFKNYPFASSDIVGFCHYNKYLGVNEDTIRSFLSANESGWVVARPVKIVKHDYPEDIAALEDVLREHHPRCYKSWRILYNSDGSSCDVNCHPANMFYTSAPEFKAYCAFVFGVLFELRHRAGNVRRSPYHKRYLAFMAERLLNVYLLTFERPVQEASICYKPRTPFGSIAGVLNLNKKSAPYAFLRRLVTHDHYAGSYTGIDDK